MGGEGGRAWRNIDIEFAFGRNFIHTECDCFFINVYMYINF